MENQALRCAGALPLRSNFPSEVEFQHGHRLTAKEPIAASSTPGQTAPRDRTGLMRKIRRNNYNGALPTELLPYRQGRLDWNQRPPAPKARNSFCVILISPICPARSGGTSRRRSVYPKKYPSSASPRTLRVGAREFKSCRWLYPKEMAGEEIDSRSPHRWYRIRCASWSFFRPCFNL